ncbi:MAG: low molecular weight protein-tyrosine-phosphatase [Flavobacteriales bacterium]
MGSNGSTLRVCVVCLGNICRSPLGEAALRQAGMTRGFRLKVSSAGTGGWHAGEAPDRRSILTAKRHGLDISKQRAQQFRPGDFSRYDLVLAMDNQNASDLQKMAKSQNEREKVHLFLRNGGNVPDPYHGDASDFEAVYQMVKTAAQEWIEKWEDEMPAT